VGEMNKEQVIKEIEGLRNMLWNKSETHSDVDIDLELTKLINKIR
jgi:hypothetical protein